MSFFPSLVEVLRENARVRGHVMLTGTLLIQMKRYFQLVSQIGRCEEEFEQIENVRSDKNIHRPRNSLDFFHLIE